MKRVVNCNIRLVNAFSIESLRLFRACQYGFDVDDPGGRENPLPYTLNQIHRNKLHSAVNQQSTRWRKANMLPLQLPFVCHDWRAITRSHSAHDLLGRPVSRPAEAAQQVGIRGPPDLRNDELQSL